ncbi:MAG TPA: non-homologous end-joining DNA ligase [Blastocatellia bacterium]|nr:non-homologous end-joining DNA ligase [Blastocatellia bacterium]
MKEKKDSQIDSEIKKAISPSKAFGQKELTGNVTIKIASHDVSLTHLEKPYFPDDGITKGDLLKYYFDISKYIVPYLKDRPLILKRFPNGITKPFFFQHDLEDHADFVRTVAIDMEVGHTVNYALCDDAAALLYLANLGTISQNPWLSRVGNLNKPDLVVWDLDPSGDDFSVVCETALAVKNALDEIGLKSYPKTSGASGIHIYVPIKPDYEFDVIAEFAQNVAEVIANKNPGIATRERAPNKRKGRVYVDHLQNARGKSVAAAYSVREKPGATVSAPLDWAEMQKKRIKIGDFTIKNMIRRIESKGDLFKDVLRTKQKLEGAIEAVKRIITR